MSEHRTECLSVRLEPPLRDFIEWKARKERRTLSATIATLVAAAFEADTNSCPWRTTASSHQIGTGTPGISGET